MKIFPLLFCIFIGCHAFECQEAVALYQDQQHEEAFKNFLAALAKPPQKVVYEPSFAEQKLYREALALYLDPSKSVEEISHETLEKWDGHKDYHCLGYLVAVAHANQNQMLEFFERFTTSYNHCPNHFLVYKAQAVLQIKLLQKMATPELQQTHKKEIVKLARQASAMEPRDAHLYRWILTFSNQQVKQQEVRRCLSKIINGSIVIPRADIAFYAKEAMEAEQFSLAEEFLQKVRQWYGYSRAAEMAQQALNMAKR